MKNLVIILGIFAASCSMQNDQGVETPAPEGQNMFGHFIPRGVTFSSAEMEEGYTLVVPPSSAEVYLINRSGEVVHSWKGNYQVMGAYLQEDGSLIQNAHDPDFPVFAGGGETGRVQQISADSRVLWDFEYANEEYHAHHDVAAMPNGNVLLIAWESRSKEEAIEAGRNPEFIPEAGIWPDKIVEVKPIDQTHGEVVWEWKFWDHMIQDFDPEKQNYGNPGEHPELLDINASAHMPDPISADSLEVLRKMNRIWRNETVENRGSDIYHINAINYNAELDQIAISSPALSEIFIIDHSTTTEEAASHAGGRMGRGGDILYRWGNPENYQQGDSLDRGLFHQHDVRWIEKGKPGEGNLTIFNNDVDAHEGAQDLNPDRWGYSSVIEIKPPMDEEGNYVIGEGAFGPDKAEWQYMASDSVSFYSSFISGAHRMENGNTFVTEGARGRVFEVTPEGEIVWEYLNPYRGNVRRPNGDLPSHMPMTYILFRSTFIPADHPGLENLDLTPLEKQPEPFEMPPPPPPES